MDWRKIEAPTLADFDEIAREAYASLPGAFRRLSGDVIIRMEDFPSEEVMRDMELETEFDILGLFQGVAMTEQSVMDSGREPNIVFLYRRPLLDYWAEHEETLGDLIRHVLIHEIGHHFGLSDDDMEELEEAAAGEGE